jgi:hypothetical protein
MKEKLLQLYTDWSKYQDFTTNKLAKRALTEATSNASNFTKFINMLGEDSATFKSVFEASKHEFSNDSIVAKRKAAKYLLEEKENKIDFWPNTYQPIDQHYTYKDDTNGVISDIAVSNHGNAAEIIQAIAGGNMQMAAALTAASWSYLSLGDRNAIFNIARTHAGYWQSGNAETKYYEVEDIYSTPFKTKSEISKSEFLDKVFPRTDPKFTRLYDDDEKKKK